MTNRKNRIFPVVITILLISIIIYLFTSIEQPYINCSKTTISDMNIKINEDLTASLDSNKISEIKLTKEIVFPSNIIADNPKIIDNMKYAIEKTYNYLGNKAKISKTDNKIVINVTVNKNETVILNNIEFVNNNGPQVKIDTNTKSSNVVTLKIADKYTEGELMTRMKNNGYTCK